MLLNQIILIPAIIFVFVSALFILSVHLKRNDVADVAWGIGITLVSFASLYNATAMGFLGVLIFVFISLWGIRLSVHIFLRNIKKPEDYRYQKWRDEWGEKFYWRSYLQVYLLQGFLMLVVGYSAIHVSLFPGGSTMNLITWLGIFIWVIGYSFEVTADYQLDSFLKDPNNKGRIIDTGLWRYSRHPNYFGEVVMWWGIWLMISPLPYSYIALISPVTITVLILFVSGVPLLEKKFADNKAFEIYKKKTSVFFPLPVKD